jgi:hypothetical protein
MVNIFFCFLEDIISIPDYYFYALNFFYSDLRHRQWTRIQLVVMAKYSRNPFVS